MLWQLGTVPHEVFPVYSVALRSVPRTWITLRVIVIRATENGSHVLKVVAW